MKELANYIIHKSSMSFVIKTFNLKIGNKTWDYFEIVIWNGTLIISFYVNDTILTPVSLYHPNSKNLNIDHMYSIDVLHPSKDD